MEGLPDEIILQINQELLDDHEPSAISFASVSKRHRALLSPVIFRDALLERRDLSQSSLAFLDCEWPTISHSRTVTINIMEANDAAAPPASSVVCPPSVDILRSIASMLRRCDVDKLKEVKIDDTGLRTYSGASATAVEWRRTIGIELERLRLEALTLDLGSTPAATDWAVTRATVLGVYRNLRSLSLDRIPMLDLVSLNDTLCQAENLVSLDLTFQFDPFMRGFAPTSRHPRLQQFTLDIGLGLIITGSEDDESDDDSDMDDEQHDDGNGDTGGPIPTSTLFTDAELRVYDPLRRWVRGSSSHLRTLCLRCPEAAFAAVLGGDVAAFSSLSRIWYDLRTFPLSTHQELRPLPSIERLSLFVDEFLHHGNLFDHYLPTLPYSFPNAQTIDLRVGCFKPVTPHRPAHCKSCAAMALSGFHLFRRLDDWARDSAAKRSSLPNGSSFMRTVEVALHLSTEAEQRSFLQGLTMYFESSTVAPPYKTLIVDVVDLSLDRMRVLLDVSDDLEVEDGVEMDFKLVLELVDHDVVIDFTQTGADRCKAVPILDNRATSHWGIT